MFRNHYDDMRPGATPERVLSICRLIAEGEYSANEIQNICQLKEKGADSQLPSEAVSMSISAAEELGYISKNAGKYTFIAEKSIIDNYISFRKAVSRNVFSNNQSTFFRVTEWFIAQEDKTFGINKFEDYSAEIIKSGIDNVKENDILGWRFWMRFLGLAYQYNRTLIPNMKVRLQDAMQEIPTNKKMTNIEFVDWLKKNVPESAASSSIARLPLAVSNGLRTLEAEKRIEIVSTQDAIKTALYPLRGVEKNDFSDIITKEALYYAVD